MIEKAELLKISCKRIFRRLLTRTNTQKTLLHGSLNRQMYQRRISPSNKIQSLLHIFLKDLTHNMLLFNLSTIQMIKKRNQRDLQKLCRTSSKIVALKIFPKTKFALRTTKNTMDLKERFICTMVMKTRGQDKLIHIAKNQSKNKNFTEFTLKNTDLLLFQKSTNTTKI